MFQDVLKGDTIGMFLIQGTFITKRQICHNVYKTPHEIVLKYDHTFRLVRIIAMCVS